MINVVVRLDKIISLNNKSFANKLNEIETKYVNEIKLLKYKIEQFEKIMYQSQFLLIPPPPPPLEHESLVQKMELSRSRALARRLTKKML